MKDKPDTPKLKKIVEDLEALIESEKFHGLEIELKDLNEALTLIKSVRRRIKAKEKYPK